MRRQRLTMLTHTALWPPPISKLKTSTAPKPLSPTYSHSHPTTSSPLSTWDTSNSNAVKSTKPSNSTNKPIKPNQNDSISSIRSLALTICLGATKTPSNNSIESSKKTKLTWARSTSKPMPCSNWANSTKPKKHSKLYKRKCQTIAMLS